jgi:hypothetical protein
MVDLRLFGIEGYVILKKDRCRKSWTAGDWLSLQARIES